MKKIVMFLIVIVGAFSGCSSEPKVDNLKLSIYNMSTQEIYYELSDVNLGEKSGTIKSKQAEGIGVVDVLEDETFTVSSLKIYKDSSKMKLIYSYDSKTDVYYECFSCDGEGGAVSFVMTEEKIIK